MESVDLAQRRLVVAANRGPVSFHDDPSGEPVVTRGPGGLVTVLTEVLRHHPGTWVAAALGDRYTPDLLNTPEARRALIEQIVNQRLLLIDARENGVVVSEELLRQIIQGIPSLNDSGKFSMERYEAMARQRGYSLAGFEDQLRRDLIMQQVLASVSNSAVSSRVAFAGTYGLLAEKREVAELRLQPDDYADGIKVADEEIAKYYEQNAARYELPEQLRAAWVTLSEGPGGTVVEAEAETWLLESEAALDAALARLREVLP